GSPRAARALAARAHKRAHERPRKEAEDGHTRGPAGPGERPHVDDRGGPPGDDERPHERERGHKRPWEPPRLSRGATLPVAAVRGPAHRDDAPPNSPSPTGARAPSPVRAR